MDKDTWSVVKMFLVDYRYNHRLVYDSVVKHLKYVFQEYKDLKSVFHEYNVYDVDDYMIENLMIDYSEGNLTAFELREAISSYQDDYYDSIDPSEVHLFGLYGL